MHPLAGVEDTAQSPEARFLPVIPGLDCTSPESWQLLSCPFRQRLGKWFLVLPAPEAGAFLGGLALDWRAHRYPVPEEAPGMPGTSLPDRAD